MTTSSTRNNKQFFEKMLVGFCQEEDPLKAILEFFVKKLLMDIQVNSQVGAENRNGYRVRRWNTRLGTLYLLIPYDFLYFSKLHSFLDITVDRGRQRQNDRKVYADKGYSSPKIEIF